MVANTKRGVLRLDYKLPENLSDFNPFDFRKKSVEFIKKIVNGDCVVCSVSGGVDSTLVAYLVQEAVGNEDLYLFFINDGLRRRIRGVEEWEVVANVFRNFKHFDILHEKDRVLPRLYGLTNGEDKRKKGFQPTYTKISNEYIKKVANKTGKNIFIFDGTIEPDIEETNGNIKTQHNVNLPYSVTKVEVLASLSKPHVRKVLKTFGLPDDVVYKIPCPGPAQMLRVVGNITDEKLEVSKIATDITEQMIEKYCEGMWGAKFRYDEVTGIRQPFQMFGVVLDNLLKRLDDVNVSISNDFKNSVRAYEMGNSATYISKGLTRSETPKYWPLLWIDPRSEMGFDVSLRIAEYMWNKFGYPRTLLQVYDSNRNEGYLVAIRAVMSEDARTAQPMKIDLDYLSRIGEQIARNSRLVKMVAYDLGIKPPATIEFE